ncbi:MAG: hypothetical protein QGI08_02845 [Paracoccaceae bacterium]|jgi:hypothetical protein|nr:hypothetical protein [Paracoccaceae bacterium]MDP7184637.1 hypothetical protein [Paracoccaceae bacterium]
MPRTVKAVMAVFALAALAACARAPVETPSPAALAIPTAPLSIEPVDTGKYK